MLSIVALSKIWLVYIELIFRFGTTLLSVKLAKILLLPIFDRHRGY